MFSYFRIGKLETYLYLPSDNDYANFGDRIQAVLDEIRTPGMRHVPWLNVERAIQEGSFLLVP
jgi:hypothetical protein